MNLKVRSAARKGKTYLIVLVCKSIEAFLNDMVSIEILDQRDDMDRQGIAEPLDLPKSECL